MITNIGDIFISSFGLRSVMRFTFNRTFSAIGLFLDFGIFLILSGEG